MWLPLTTNGVKGPPDCVTGPPKVLVPSPQSILTRLFELDPGEIPGVSGKALWLKSPIVAFGFASVKLATCPEKFTPSPAWTGVPVAVRGASATVAVVVVV